MRKTIFFNAILMGLLFSFLFACPQSDQSESGYWREQTLKGKNIFEVKGCGQCHYIGDEEVYSEAPDLRNPFLANDSLFVQAHLKFVETSEMPPIEMTAEEIRLVSSYVAQLYNAKLPKLPEDEVDAYDPVCYAPVSMKRAYVQKLYATFREKKYYFATEKTLATFKKAPEAFVVLYNRFLEEKEESSR